MQRVIDELVNQWLFDVAVFSHWWLYAPLLIPAVCYLAFFLLKWMVLTAPVWFPIAIIIRTCKS